MKKILNPILLALSLLGLLVACNKPEQEVVQKKALKVLSSNVIFSVDGGEGSIQVEADEAVTATSERAWCQVSVDGKTIRVTVAEPNLSRMSRYARITIKAGSDESHVTAQQFGEVFSGMDLEDVTVGPEGATFRYAYLANMDVRITSDQPWVHFEKEEGESTIMKIVVDANPGFGYRFATVNFTAGSNTGTARVTQEPTYGAVTGWSAADADGRFVFPDQIDLISITPPSELASAPYFWDVVDPSNFAGVTDVAAKIKEQADALMAQAQAGEISFTKGSASKEFSNLPSTALALIIVFDEQNYPTGQYALVEVSVPDRGPRKQLTDGWDITHDSSTYTYPDQVDVFTVTPKAGFEDVKYLATVVPKSQVADVEDYAFVTFAMAEREAILAKVASGELPSFDAGLNTGTATLTAKNLSGDVYVFIVAFDDHQFYSGQYSYAEFTVANAKRAYWIGTWKMTNTAGQSYTWTIEEKGDDSGKLSMFCDGLYTGTGSTLKRITRFDLIVNADNSITLNAQEHPELDTYYNTTYGNLYPNLFGYFIRDGSTYYTNLKNGEYEIVTLSMTDDGVATVSHVGTSSDGIAYLHFAVRYYSSVRAALMSFTSNTSITIDGLTLTKN